MAGVSSSLSSSFTAPTSVTAGRSANVKSSASPFLKGGGSIRIDVRRKASEGKQVTCRKKGIHPEIFPEAKVMCNGEHVMTTAGTVKEYDVDVWSGNHPFYLGERTSDLLVNDRIELFRRRYYDGTNDEDFVIPNLTKGEIILPKRKKNPKKKK